MQIAICIVNVSRFNHRLILNSHCNTECLPRGNHDRGTAFSSILAWDLAALCRILPFEVRSP